MNDLSNKEKLQEVAKSVSRLIVIDRTSEAGKIPVTKDFTKNLSAADITGLKAQLVAEIDNCIDLLKSISS